jgi:hypothetical protein
MISMISITFVFDGIGYTYAMGSADFNVIVVRTMLSQWKAQYPRLHLDDITTSYAMRPFWLLALRDGYAFI